MRNKRILIYKYIKVIRIKIYSKLRLKIARLIKLINLLFQIVIKWLKYWKVKIILMNLKEWHNKVENLKLNFVIYNRNEIGIFL